MVESRAVAVVAVIVCACVCMTFACRGRLLRSGGLTSQDKQTIVDLHNQMRSQVASGRIQGQPAAANMLEMVWDEELARKAQEWANRCQNGHDSSTARRVSRFAVGQNIASTWSSPHPNRLGSQPDFNTQIAAWFNEVYQYRGGFSHGTGHYSQMVWGETYLVGCGYSYYQDGSRYTKLYICNYGPAGNVLGHSPYRQGAPACARFGTSPSRRFPGLCEPRGAYSQSYYYG
ncbi:venom allergen 5-like [Macrosteles quadrilineatus]|uniref:venom allergen 5-like n=1 Tax=Macrosteles quadrilineatus TaxID=74068 RepID=UPI0023E25367|nr:venom allergen 5-like [Macrosteles quadrilineatus]